MFSKQELIKGINPGYLIGEEVGMIEKNSPRINAAIFLPKYYNIAMTNIYMHSLYNLFNSFGEVYVQRSFLIEEYFQNILKERNEIYFTIEKKEEINKMNYLFIILEDELEITSCLNVLNLAKVPTMKSRRESNHPKIVFLIKKHINIFSVKLFADYIFYLDDIDEIKKLCDLVLLTKKTLKEDEIIKLYEKNSKTYYPKYISSALVPSISIANNNLLILLNGTYINEDEVNNLIEEIKRGYNQTGIKNICFLDHDNILEEEFLKIIEKLRENDIFKKSQITLDDFYITEKNIWKTKYIEEYIPKIKIPEYKNESMLKIIKELLKEGYKTFKLIYEVKQLKTSFHEIKDVLKLADDISKLYFMYYLIKPEKPIVHISLLYYNLNSMIIPEKLENKISFLKSQLSNQYVSINSENEYKVVLRYVLRNLKNDILGAVIYKAWKARCKRGFFRRKI